MAVRKLTARFVETAKAENGRAEFRDADVRGLELRVSAAGGKTWALRYRRQSDGAKRTATLGEFPEFSLEHARRWALEQKAAVARGADPATDVINARVARRKAETFAEVAEEWIERHGKPNKAPRTLRDDQNMLARHVLPAIGGMKANEITKRDLIRLFDTIAATPDGRAKDSKAAPRKLTHQPNRVFEVVRSIFRWAVGRDLLQLDPTAGMSPPIKKEKPRERDLTPDEIAKLWAALNRAPAGRRYARGLPRGARATVEGDLSMTRATALTLKLALATAQRIGEVAGMSVAELDLNDTAPVWTIPGERCKNGQANRVPLSALAVRLIGEARELAGGSPWLFPSPQGGGPIDPHAPTKALERARPAIGLEDFRIHDLRRTAATRMAEMGISPHTISLVLNHISARAGNVTGKVYVQYSYDREKREALGAWGARLDRIVSGADGGNVVAIRPAAASLDRGAIG
jgi:integrase